ncbi:MAG: hypothetical protein QM706_17960 [Nitrospira sp.]
MQFIIAGFVASLVLFGVAVYFAISANSEKQNANHQAAVAQTSEAHAQAASTNAVDQANIAMTEQARALT